MDEGTKVTPVKLRVYLGGTCPTPTNGPPDARRRGDDDDVMG